MCEEFEKNARWIESVGEDGHNLETSKARKSIITKRGSLQNGPIGFIVKLTLGSTPRTSKFHKINIYSSFCPILS